MTSYDEWTTSGSPEPFGDPDVACEAYWSFYQYHGDETLVLDEMADHEANRGIAAEFEGDPNLAATHFEGHEALQWAADIVDDPDVVEEI